MAEIEVTLSPGQGVMCYRDTSNFTLIRLVTGTIDSHVRLNRADRDDEFIVSFEEPKKILLQPEDLVIIELVRWEGIEPVLNFSSKERTFTRWEP